MLKIEYHKKYGCVFADGQIMDIVRYDWLESERQEQFKALQQNSSGIYSRTVASEVYILALQLLIAQGEIDHTKVKLTYVRSKDNQIELTIDERGYINSYPDGFCDTNEKVLVALDAAQNKD